MRNAARLGTAAGPLSSPVFSFPLGVERASEFVRRRIVADLGCSGMNASARWPDLILPIGVVGSILVILAPLPTAILDLLLAANITAAVLILLTTIFIRSPLEFSIFPTLLLATTLSRLVLNVASTRLILARASDEGLQAAGGVIEAFSQFIAGDRVLVGLVVFVILVVIQLVVITAGATRISEVAARFALDGMPGRQAAVDAERSAGVIDDAEAQRRRGEIQQQADFYGAMDGASKFVRGDAIASLVITAINIFGGLTIGVVESGLSLTEAADLYTRLTIGDGLVSQVPALLISLAAGLLVTRSGQQLDLPRVFLEQLLARPQALLLAGIFLGVLVFTQLPTIPLLTLAGVCVGLAVMTKKQQPDRTGQPAPTPAQPAVTPKRTEPTIEEFLAIDPMEIEIGLGLIGLADPQQGGDLLARITIVRRTVASELGMVLPKVRIRDNLQLDPNQYRLKIAGSVVASGSIQPNRLLAVRTSWSRGELSGEACHDPATGEAANWVDPSERLAVERRGFRLLDSTGLIAHHLQQVVRKHAAELLTRDATQRLIDELRKTAPTVVDELLPNTMKLAEVQQVLRLLLAEGVSIRQLATILETLGDHAAQRLSAADLTERVRRRLARTLCNSAADADGVLTVVTLAPPLETRLAELLRIGESGVEQEWRIDPTCVELLGNAVESSINRWCDPSRGHPVLLVKPTLRRLMRHLLTPRLPRLTVLSTAELASEVPLRVLGAIADPLPPSA